MSKSVPKKLHDQLWRQLQATFIHCLSYMGNPTRVEGNTPGIAIGWKGADRLTAARDGLQYRNHALLWHLSLLDSYKKHFECAIEKVIFDSEKEFYARRDAQQKLGFILDDVVFNSMSVFDYTAEFVFATHFPDYKGDKRWHKLTQKIAKIDDEILSKLIQSANLKFVKHLERYRGHVIHNKPEVGDIVYTHAVVTGEVKHDIALPRKLIDLLPIFSADGENIQIDAGAEKIIVRTMEIELSIVYQLSLYKYKPRRDNIFDDSKYT